MLYERPLEAKCLGLELRLGSPRQSDEKRSLGCNVLGRARLCMYQRPQQIQTRVQEKRDAAVERLNDGNDKKSLFSYFCKPAKSKHGMSEFYQTHLFC